MTPQTASVGIRELRDRLSAYVARVRQGGEVIVTDRGKPVARLIGHDRDDPIERLIEAGLVQPARTAKTSAPKKRVRVKGEVSSLVSEQRR